MMERREQAAVRARSARMRDMRVTQAVKVFAQKENGMICGGAARDVSNAKNMRENGNKSPSERQ